MKRKGNISAKIRTEDNFRRAEDSYAEDKHNRRKVVKFERDLDVNIFKLLSALTDGTWQPAKYHDKEIVENGKHRRLCIYPMEEHVMEWAHINYIEKLMTDTYIRNSCSCVKGRGQTDFIKQLYHYTHSDPEGTRYGVQLDAHHFFPNIDHNIMKERLAKKIKDKQVLQFLYDTIDNYPNGIVLGTKLSQIEGNFYLAPFDHKALRLFDIMKDPERYAYWERRYINGCIDTCRTQRQADELNLGIQYLKGKFRRLCLEWIANRYLLRFADNIVMMSSDKVFLHLVVEMAITELWNSYKVRVNKSWNIRPVDDGIDICGYVVFHDHILVRKRDKKALCKQVSHLRKKGCSDEEIRVKAASRIGWCIHADARNLIKKLHVNMVYRRIGVAIKAKKHTIPFQGFTREQYESVTTLVCEEGEDENFKMIMLNGYVVLDSVAKAGTKCLWFRYNHVTEVRPKLDTEGKPVLDAEGDPELEYDIDPTEHYSYSGSNVLIEQATEDFPQLTFPSPTVIKSAFSQNKRSRYYKFT